MVAGFEGLFRCGHAGSGRLLVSEGLGCDNAKAWVKAAELVSFRDIGSILHAFSAALGHLYLVA
jgi:hypothetical protein